jgi:hypothetical protein
MVGLIHKTLFGLIESAAGRDAAREARRRANVPEDKVFRLDTPYDDAEWRRLLAAACQVLGVTQPQAEQAFAEYFCQDALKRWPTWFAMSHNAREFLERQPTIHNSMAGGIQDPEARQAVADKFTLEKGAAELVIRYRSPNQLCGLYLAIARWLINHYGDEATVEEARCLKKGDPECEVHIRWPGPGDRP